MGKEIIRAVTELTAKRNILVKVKDNSLFTHKDIADYISGLNVDGKFKTIAARAIAEKVSKTVGFYKNTIKPFQTELAEKTAGMFSIVDKNNTQTGLDVVSIGVPMVIDELVDAKMLIKDTTSIEDIKISSSVVSIPKPDEDIYKCFTFGSSSLDESLGSILASFTREDLEEIWEVYMTDVRANNKAITKLVTAPVLSIRQSVLVFAAVENVLTSGISLNKSQEQQLIAYRNYLNKAIFIGLETHSKQFRNNILIIKNEGKKAYVNAKTYKKFLEDNKNEVLLGYLIANDDEKLFNISMSDVLRDSKGYVKLYEAYERKSEVHSRLESIKQYRTAYITALSEIMSGVSEQPVGKFIRISKDSAVEKTREMLKGLSDANIVDVDEVCRKITGEIVFSYSSYMDFTNAMVEYEKIVNGVKITPSPDEAATAATIRLLVNYIFDEHLSIVKK